MRLYALKIKSICESLASINVKVEDDDKLEVCLRGLGPQYKSSKRLFSQGITDSQALRILFQCQQLKKEIWQRIQTKETLKVRRKQSTIVLEEAEERVMEDLVKLEQIITIKEEDNKL